MEAYLWVIIVIIVFSIVQSFFGVGLLVFGTPTLLLLGIPFDLALTYLLPSSVMISLIQVLHSKSTTSYLAKKILLYSTPGIVVGLFFVISGYFEVNIGVVIGLVLLLSVMIRQIEQLKSKTQQFVHKNLKMYLLIMGIVHGLSNMGGGLLAVLASTINNEKEVQRKNIAFGYLIFGLTQILVLVISSFHLFTYMSILLPIISLIIYFIIGNVVFKMAPEFFFNRMFTWLLLLYGLILVYTSIT
jgi:uncharacterized protein